MEYGVDLNFKGVRLDVPMHVPRQAREKIDKRIRRKCLFRIWHL